MSRSRESRPRGSRKQQTKITYAARARTLNRFKKIIMGHRVRSLSSFSLVMCYCFRAPIYTFLFLHLSNDCQITCSALVSSSSNREPYNRCEATTLRNRLIQVAEVAYVTRLGCLCPIPSAFELSWM